jgi:hypothetical protein
VAAPVFKEIAENVLPYMSVEPDAESKPAPPQAGMLARESRTREATPAAEAQMGAPAGSSPVPVIASREGRGGGDDGGSVVFAAARERALLMPDLRGRSVRDAARICAQLGLDLEARGEGRALRQQPAGGASVEAGQLVRVEFGRSD